MKGDKAKHFNELVAMKGNVDARHNLGVVTSLRLAMSIEHLSTVSLQQMLGTGILWTW